MKKDHPLISIITVTYDAEKYLSASIASIRRQNFSDFEYIIIDGGSKDQTLEIIQDNKDIITLWISEPDKGIYDAMNKALKYARGSWLYFLGADDILLPGFSEMARSLKDHKTIYYGTAKCGDGLIGRSSYDAYQVASLNMCHQTMFYPRLVFEKYQYETKYKVRADHYLNILCFSDKELKFRFLPLTICIYDPGGFSGRTDDPEFYKDLNGIIKKHFGLWTAIRYKLRTIRHKIKGRSRNK